MVSLDFRNEYDMAMLLLQGAEKVLKKLKKKSSMGLYADLRRQCKALEDLKQDMKDTKKRW